MRRPDAGLQVELDAIYRDRGRSELERLAAAYGASTAVFIAGCERQRDLARALGDEETAVREQIKAAVMAEAREIFAAMYAGVSHERTVLWDE